jgi:hypothetical protein
VEPRAGRSPAIDVQVRPASVVRTAYGLKSPFWWFVMTAYAVLASCTDALMRATYASFGTPGIDSTLRQVAPASSLTWISPSSVPT